MKLPWPFRRKAVVELSIPGDSPVPPQKNIGNADASPTLPQTIDPLYGVPWRKDPDAILKLNADGYKLLRRSPIVFQPFFKAAQHIRTMDLVAVSKNRPGSERQKAAQEMLDNTPGIQNLILWLMLYGYTEGVTFYQIKAAEDRETGTEWVLPDLRDGGIHKHNAVEDRTVEAGLDTDRKNIVKRQTFQPFAPDDVNAPASFDPEGFIVFAPGSTTSGEGNLHFARVLLPLAFQYEEAARDLEEYIHLFAIPYRKVSVELTNAQPSKEQQLLALAMGAVSSLNPKKNTVALPNGTSLDMQEPQGTGARIIMDRLEHLEDQAHRIVLATDLTSSAKPTGMNSSAPDNASEDQNKNIIAYARDIADAIAAALMPWMDRMNEEFPALAKAGDKQDMELADVPEPVMVPAAPKVPAQQVKPEPKEDKDEAEIYFRFQPEGRRHTVGLDDINPAPEEGMMAPPELTDPDAAPAGQPALEMGFLRDTLEAVSYGTLPRDAAKLMLERVYPAENKARLHGMVDDVAKLQLDDEGSWVTINGAAVFIDGAGNITKGPDGLVGRRTRVAKSGKRALRATKDEMDAEAHERYARGDKMDSFYESYAEHGYAESANDAKAKFEDERDARSRAAGSETDRDARAAKREEVAKEKVDSFRKKLKENGWVKEHTSDSGSEYWAKGDRRIRVADHALPQTAEREFAHGQGNKSFTGHDNFVYANDKGALSGAVIDARIAEIELD